MTSNRAVVSSSLTATVEKHLSTNLGGALNNASDEARQNL